VPDRGSFACLAAVAAAFALAGCVTLTATPRAILRDGDTPLVRALPCDAARVLPASFAASAPLDPHAIRLVSWNIHKQADAGWLRDLRRFTRQSDIVLLQEAVLDLPIRRLIDDEGFTWTMASSFEFGGADIGVMTASRVAPRDVCTLRADEPLLHIPKSAVVAWYALPGRAQTLAIANVHATNFALSLDAYRRQLDALADALAPHRGPLIIAGDFNTWSAGRTEVLQKVASRLGSTEVRLPANARSRFLGHEVDHIYVRGLVPIDARGVSVTSSDHNPVLATLRVVD
jgi:endonuclease/exonuclease/phosphatase (EEP) superfamily protein YafD